MANAAAKRIANQNDSTVRALRLGILIPSALHILFRLLFHRSSIPPSKRVIAIYTFTFLPCFFLSNYLIKIGTPRRDPTTGTLISYGEDLNQAGVTEWCFDVLYVTYICQVGSGLFGDWVWWLYLVIPLYALFKVWTFTVGPMFGFGAPKADVAAEADASAGQPATSKRQEKLKKRSEKGDPRVKAQTVRSR
ncbi:hypothetical protein BDV98DRAFT_541645 [Pterulicium gracile]|uniref:DUF788-domain-containing protein n=1 Tax=Pterulicium gracile TaxID=1884261 RepID=A0A5C3QYP3_9AGAR|nr:hypothetical protein BDV98DRAFT_541645 [Pterula gracilis]